MSGRRSTIYLEPDLHKRLRRRGAEEERTVSEMVNTAVAHWLDAPADTAVPSSATPAGGAGVPDASAGADARAAAMVGNPGERVHPAVAAIAAIAATREEPAAPTPDGLAPPVRRLFGALRPAAAPRGTA